MKNRNKTYLLALIVFIVGVVMLLGSSYSLVLGNVTSNESYGFEVANFNVEFLDNAKISISGIPMDDVDGIKNSKEYSFTVTNNSDYDVNYRLDIIENGNTNMNSVIHYVYSINDGEYSEVLNLAKNYTIKQNKVLKVNAIDVYKIKIWLSDDADESFMNKTFSGTLSLMATQNEYKYATNVIEKLALNNQDNIQEDNNEYRYSKNNSLNYVWFNCKDGFTKGDNYCEKWRIIGSFNNKKEDSIEEYKMLKIVNTNINDKISYNNEDKNGDYDNSYIESYANGFYYDKLNEDAKKQIMRARWNIADVKSDSYIEVLNEEKEKTYYGNIGLLNISDYLYLREESFFDNENIMFLNKKNGNILILGNEINIGNNNEDYGFLPCVYLRPDISIISGDGSIDTPYEIGIKFPMNY